jgi:hypothetical protein
MRVAWLVGRAWDLHIGLGLAAAVSLLAREWWNVDATVPTVDRALPMAAVVPPALALATAWTLVERWPIPTQAAARSLVVVRAVRFAAVVTTCAAAGAVASWGDGQGETPAVAVIGVACAATLTPTTQRWTWLPLTAAGYAWLQHAARGSMGDYLPHDAAVAIAACIVGAVVYAADLTMRPAVRRD